MESIDQIINHLHQWLKIGIRIYLKGQLVKNYLDEMMPNILLSWYDQMISTLLNTKSIHKETIMVHYEDRYNLSGAMIIFQDYQLIIGPYLDGDYPVDSLNQLKKDLKANSKESLILSSFFDHMCILNPNDLRFIYAILIQHPNYEQDLSIRMIRQKKKKVSDEHIVSNDEDELKIVEHNYAIENELMQAIKQGDLIEINRVIKVSREVRIPERVPRDSLRNQKNSLIILNTLATRKAIEGGLDHLHAHRLSTMHGIMIEQMKSSLDIERMTRDIIVHFAEAVHEFNSKLLPPLIKNVVLYVHRHIGDEIKLEDLAKINFVSIEHLSRMFKKVMGVNFHEWLIHMKMVEAKKLIEQNELPMIDIASMLGFSSGSHFSTLFKKHTGYSPKQYQQVNLQ